MPGVIAHWNGSIAEAARFMAAVRANCTCKESENGRCAMHAMMDSEAKLNRMIFAYRIRDRLVMEEMSEPKAPTQT